MIEWLESLDYQLLLAVNGLRSGFLDEMMWIISGKLTWFPLYLLLIYYAFRKLDTKSFIYFLVIGIACVGLADFTATFGFKEQIARYRPSHHAILGDLLQYYEIKPGEFYRGGQYGFVSGHATNSFAIAIYFGLFFRKAQPWLFWSLITWAIVICYSRMYLGVHYPSDLIGGTILGSTIATIGHFTWKKFSPNPKTSVMKN